MLQKHRTIHTDDESVVTVPARRSSVVPPSKRKRKSQKARNQHKKAVQATAHGKAELRRVFGARFTDGASNMGMVLEEVKIAEEHKLSPKLGFTDGEPRIQH